jgi:hypothetical protein
MVLDSEPNSPPTRISLSIVEYLSRVMAAFAPKVALLDAAR